MLGRYIHTALRAGFSYYRRSGKAPIEDLFKRQYDVGDIEIEAITTYLQKYPPEVKQGYPRDEVTAAPSLFIFMSSSSQPGFALAGLAGTGTAPVAAASPAAAAAAAIPQGGVNFPSPGGNTFIRSSIWSHQYQIMVIARAAGPEPVIWTSTIAQSILIGAKKFFDTKGLLSPVLAASDVNFRADLAPNDLYARSLTFQCSREFTQADSSGGFAKALSVEGLNQAVLSGDDDGRPVSAFTVQPPSVS